MVVVIGAVLSQPNRANTRHLPVAAPGEVVVEHIEADAAMDVERGAQLAARAVTTLIEASCRPRQ